MIKTLCALLLFIFSSKVEAHPPFVVFSPPKAGTHLVGKAMALLTDESPAYHLSRIGESPSDLLSIVMSETERGEFTVAHHFTHHALTHLTQMGYKVIFVVRDPRDQLISVMHWLKKGQWRWLPIARIEEEEELITELITGSTTRWRSVEKCYLQFESILEEISQEKIYFAHFEKLVGAQGGGGREEQIEELRALAQFVEIPISSEAIESLADTLFGGTATFRQGQIGSWKESFTDEQKELFKERYQPLLERLGYEMDDCW